MATNAKIGIEADVSQAQSALRSLVSSLDGVKTAAANLEKSLGSGLAGGLNTANTGVKNLNTSMGTLKTTGLSLTSMFSGLVASFGLAKIVQAGDAYTQFSNQIKSVSSNQQELSTAMSGVAKIATETGTPLNQVGQLYSRLTVAGQNLGISQDRVMRATESISKQMKIFGLDAANASSVMYQFGQAVGMGVARTEELKQIMEASPAFIKGMAEAFGKSTAEFMADVAARKVGGEDLIAAQEWMLNKINPQWSNYQKTVGDALTSVSNNFSIMLGRMESSYGVFSKVASALDWVGKNLDLVAAAGAAFFTIFAVRKILAVAEAFGILNAVVGKNPFVKLAVAIIAAGTALATYLGVSKEAEQVLKKEAAAQEELNQKTLEYKGPQVDVKALTAAAQELGKQQQFLTSIASLSKLRQEQEKAVWDFAKAQGIEYSKIPANVANILRGDVARRQEAEFLVTLGEDYKRVQAEIEIANARGLIQQEQLRAIERVRLQYGDEYAKRAKGVIEAQIKELVISKELAKYEKAGLDAASDQAFYKANINQLSSAQLENFTKQWSILREIGITEENTSKEKRDQLMTAIALEQHARKQLEYYKQIKTAIEGVNVALTGPAAGAGAAQQLGGLDPMTAAKTANETLYNGLEYLRQNDLISEQQYQTAKVAAAVQANDQIMAAQQKLYETQKMYQLQNDKNSIFGYEQQKQIASESAKFQMKSDFEKTQFAIENIGSVFSALGAQNKKAFEASKAFNIATALMNTYMGATKALATYPWPFGLIAAAAAVAAGLAQVAAIRSQQYSGRALGGPVMGGQSYIVGESGPELFTPATTGSITRNSDLGGGGTVNVNFQIVANDTAGFDQLLASRKGVIQQIISDAMLEKGKRSMV